MNKQKLGMGFTNDPFPFLKTILACVSTTNIILGLLPGDVSWTIVLCYIVCVDNKIQDTIFKIQDTIYLRLCDFLFDFSLNGWSKFKYEKLKPTKNKDVGKTQRKVQTQAKMS